MEQFELRLILTIIQNCSINDIRTICFASSQCQSFCKDNEFWRKRLYHDYGLFMEIINEFEHELYFDVYKKLYLNRVLNSPDFHKLYNILIAYDPNIYFFNEESSKFTTIPTLMHPSKLGKNILSRFGIMFSFRAGKRIKLWHYQLVKTSFSNLEKIGLYVITGKFVNKEFKINMESLYTFDWLR